MGPEAIGYFGIFVGFVVSAYFSGCETGIYRLNRVRLRLAQQHGRPRAGLLRRLVADVPGLICVTLIGTNLGNYLTTALATRLWVEAAPEASDLYASLMATVTIAPLLFLFAELLPKNLYNADADRLMFAGARPLWLSNLLFRGLGLVALLKGVGRLGMLASGAGRRGVRPIGDLFPARARLRSIVRDSAAEGVVTPYQNELVESIMSLHGVHVSDAMVPRGRVVGVPETADREAFVRIVSEHRYSRLPVATASGRDYRGIVVVDEVLEPLSRGEPFRLADHVRAAVELSPAMTVTQAIFALQRNRQPMAVVRSPRGQAIGIITLKDLMEEIVGELGAW